MINWVKIADNRALLCMLLLIYKLTLDVFYQKLIIPFNGYIGFVDNFFLYKYILSFVFFLLLVPSIIKNLTDQSVSSCFVVIFNLFYFIPGCTLYAFSGLDDLYFLFFLIYWMLIQFWHIYIPRFKFQNKIVKRNNSVFYLFISMMIISGIAMSGLYNNFQFHFGIMDVYDYRFDFMETERPTIVRYLQPLVSSILPIALVFFLIKKKIFWSVIIIVVQLLLFGMGAQKSTLFALFLSILSFFFYRPNRQYLMLVVVIFLNVLAMIEAGVNNGMSLIGILLQFRMYFIPTMISFQMYDFFSFHEHLYLRDSILTYIGFTNPYNEPIPVLIGRMYSDIEGTWANNGFCGDAFYQFGWLGLVIYPFLIVVSLRFFEACSRGLDVRILFASSILFSIAFINGSFFTIMLTNGFIFTCLFLYFMPRKL